MSFPLPPAFAEHPTEELLEEYCFGRVGEPALAHLEEHLFVCDGCQDKLEEVDAYIALMKNATSAWVRCHDRTITEIGPRRRSLTWQRAVLGASLAAGLACILVLGGRGSFHPGPSAPSIVRLVAMRGGEFEGLASAPAGKPLQLTLDRSSLAPHAGYRMEIVNQEGHQVWIGVPEVDGAALSARVARGPQPGVYWVRLYSESGELLREFGMRIE